MTARIIIVITAITALFICSCASKTDIGAADPASPRLEVMFSFNTASYKKFVKTFYPQIAVWVAEPGQKFTKTIYATESGAKEDWWGAEKRPSALPVWDGIKGSEQGIAIDSISGATPSGETFKITWTVPENLRGKKVSVFIEANVSFDYNDHYRKDAKEGEKGWSDVNGQPSLVWKGDITLTGDGTEAIPAVIGHGHVLGGNSAVDKDLSTVTTAKELFHYIKAVYREGTKK